MDFDNRLKEFVLSENGRDKEYYKIKPSVYHISSLGMCPRLIFFDTTLNVEKDEEVLRIFLVGNIFHKWMQDNLLSDYTLEYEINKEFDGIKLVGRIDAINDKEILELKTCSSIGYIRKIKPEHIAQINTYMGITGIHNGRIIYIEKNNLNTKEFNIKFSGTLFDETIRKIKMIDRKIKENANYKDIIPAMSPNCYNCLYRIQCLYQE